MKTEFVSPVYFPIIDTFCICEQSLWSLCDTIYLMIRAIDLCHYRNHNCWNHQLPNEFGTVHLFPTIRFWSDQTLYAITISQLISSYSDWTPAFPLANQSTPGSNAWKHPSMSYHSPSMPPLFCGNIFSYLPIWCTTDRPGRRAPWWFQISDPSDWSRSCRPPKSPWSARAGSWSCLGIVLGFWPVCYWRGGSHWWGKCIPP